MIKMVTVTLAFVLTHFEHSTHAQNNALKDLYSKGGVNCCTTADGATVKDPDWGIEGSSYWVFLDGERRSVPPAAVVDAANPTNMALVWVVYQNGIPQIKCFLRGHLI